MSQKGIMNDRQLIMGKIGQQIYRIFSLLININKRYLEKKILNNQQYFWSIYQQLTSKIMAKSTINRKVCTPSYGSKFLLGLPSNINSKIPIGKSAYINFILERFVAEHLARTHIGAIRIFSSI